MAFAIRDRRTGLHYAGTLKRVSATVWRRRPQDAVLFATGHEALAEMERLRGPAARTCEVVRIRTRGDAPAPVDDLFGPDTGAAANPPADSRRGRDARPACRERPPASAGRRGWSGGAAGKPPGRKGGKPAAKPQVEQRRR